MSLIVDAILLGMLALILFGLYSIPIVKRNVKWLWYKHYAIIIGILAALFISFVVMPRILK